MKRNSIIALIIVIALMSIGYFILPLNSINNDVQVKISSLSFESKKEDFSVMKVEYLIGVSNNGNDTQEFYLKISPKDLDWFPYLHCLPKEYISEKITLDAGQGEMLILVTEYQTDENKSTSGHLSDKDLTIEIIDANK